MTGFFNNRLDWLWRVSLAQFTTIFLFLMNLSNFSFPMSGPIRPYFILMFLFYWSVYRPTLISPIFVFFLGVIFDLVLGYPLGLHSILFLVFQWVVSDQRLYFLGQPFFLVWIGFCLSAFCIYSFEWIFFSAYQMMWIETETLLLGFIFTICIFPLISLLFTLVHRFLPAENKAFG
jgi:rod shape-determining protein MreD